MLAPGENGWTRPPPPLRDGCDRSAGTRPARETSALRSARYTLEMSHLFVPETSVAALIVRAAVVYGFLLVALRVAGRRELAQMTSFDLILLLVISNAVQNSMNAGDNSLGGGLVSAVTLIALNWLVGYATWRWRRVERVIQGEPIRVVTDGRVHVGALRRELLTLSELSSALRKQGIMRITDCKHVTLEPDGTLTAIRRDVDPPSLADLAHPDRVFAAR